MKLRNKTQRLVLAALFLSLGLVLPFITGNIPQIGTMLCPMHFPVLICGFVLGGPVGLVVGLVTPLLRSVLFGMPALYPQALAMACELGTYGLVSGLLFSAAPKRPLPVIYGVLLSAMTAGRLVWGAARFVLAGLSGSAFPLSAFLSGALLNSLPGIAAQLVLIPLILTGLQRAKLLDP